MRSTDILFPLSFITSLPACVSASPVGTRDTSDSHIAARGPQPGVCGGVPKWIDDVPHFEKQWGYTPASDRSSPESQDAQTVGSAESCLAMAQKLEDDGSREWDISRALWDNNSELEHFDECNFHVSPFQKSGWVVIIQGQDVADIVRDAVKRWCPDAWRIDENGKMVAKPEDHHKACPMLGHGVVDDCMQRAHKGTSSLMWTISSNVDDWSDDGKRKNAGVGWSGGPI